MKRNRVFRILAMAVVLSLLMLALPVAPALAAVTFTLDDSSGYVGEPIPFTSSGFDSGAGYSEGDTGYVWFDSNDNDELDSGETYVAVQVDSEELDITSGTLTVPEVPRGGYYVRVGIPNDSSVVASDGYTVNPEITLNDSSGNVGDSVTVNGTGFDDTTGITILFDGDSVGTDSTDSDGSFDFSFTIPDSVEGSHTIKAQETSSTTHNDTATYTVSPEIILDPTSGVVGDEVTITGTGFDANSDIEIFFGSGDVDIESGDTDTDNDDGSFECTFLVPEAARGSHTVEVEDEGNNSATATFSVSTSITIDPTSGAAGTVVTITGTGFRASRSIYVYFDDVEQTITSGDETTDSDGGFDLCTFVVPAKETGTYEIEVSDGSYSATADFDYTTDATISQETTESDPGYVGMELTIEGTGFTADSSVTITFLSTEIDLGTFDTDEDGDFEADITIPASEGGEHTITVTDDTDTNISKEFSFYMEEDAPDAPTLVAPLADEKADAEATFTWVGVSDISGVTYELQVSTTSAFTTGTLLVDETALEVLTYTIAAANKLESTGSDAPYYWRVRAVDGASNESDWTDPRPFYVGFSFQLTGWVLWVVMGAIAVVFFLAGLLVGKKAGGGGYYY